MLAFFMYILPKFTKIVGVNKMKIDVSWGFIINNLPFLVRHS
ncbi:hypothetical protein DFQ02_10942 [Seonamhaeicola aphaedonensis]|uniref:Uncharacterized protein n=1 Tax=Seonamhaeicola aphaedonensis TaxID=1461338 RepID=A0A3D9H5Z3_9FLAO|nr:hypothetical protein DFQ02_10942 [Seonamhaeicola aphaedonensis]